MQSGDRYYPLSASLEVLSELLLQRPCAAADDERAGVPLDERALAAGTADEVAHPFRRVSDVGAVSRVGADAGNPKELGELSEKLFQGICGCYQILAGQSHPLAQMLCGFRLEPLEFSAPIHTLHRALPHACGSRGTSSQPLRPP